MSHNNPHPPHNLLLKKLEVGNNYIAVDVMGYSGRAILDIFTLDELDELYKTLLKDIKENINPSMKTYKSTLPHGFTMGMTCNKLAIKQYNDLSPEDKEILRQNNLPSRSPNFTNEFLQDPKALKLREWLLYKDPVDQAKNAFLNSVAERLHTRNLPEQSHSQRPDTRPRPPVSSLQRRSPGATSQINDAQAAQTWTPTSAPINEDCLSRASTLSNRGSLPQSPKILEQTVSFEDFPQVKSIESHSSTSTQPLNPSLTPSLPNNAQSDIQRNAGRLTSLLNMICCRHDNDSANTIPPRKKRNS